MGTEGQAGTVTKLTEILLVEKRGEDTWDNQIANDLKAGKLDQLIAKAEAVINTKPVKDLKAVLNS